MLEIWYNKISARVGVRSARARAAGTRYPKGTGTGALRYWYPVPYSFGTLGADRVIL
jgi:hypothetical protein